jgi:ligand-binding SRPBCC domain-containing protein
MARIESRVEIRVPLERAFWFLANGDNAAQWSLSVEEAHHETPPPIQVGSRLAVKAHAGNRHYAWTQVVTAWDPPHGFADRMLPGAGPFRSFEDWGKFEATPRGTSFTFGIDYRLPGGPIGWLLDRLWLARRVRHEQSASLEKAKSLLESPSVGAGVPVPR